MRKDHIPLNQIKMICLGYLADEMLQQVAESKAKSYGRTDLMRWMIPRDVVDGDTQAAYNIGWSIWLGVEGFYGVRSEWWYFASAYGWNSML